MKRLPVLFFAVLLSALLCCGLATAGDPLSQLFDAAPLDHSWRADEQWRERSAPEAVSTNPRIYQDVDITHYTIDATFVPGDPYPDNSYIEATTTIEGSATGTLTQLVVDLYDNVDITALRMDGESFTAFTRSDNKVWIDLSTAPLETGEGFVLQFDHTRFYDGAFQGIKFNTHGDEDSPSIYSLDQPYQSPGWWPCFDYPAEKATADIYITCPGGMSAVSNGLLQGGYPFENGDGTTTFYWKESYPLYTSALSVAMADYVVWEDAYVSPFDGTEMPLVYYAFPEDAAKAQTDYAVSGEALVFFAQLFGEYPFINEKYGVAETASPMGNLEHQTITSLTYSVTRKAVNWDIIVHELAHQWWGDWVTCRTWNHLWLQEGLASYAEVLFNEFATGTPAGQFLAEQYDDGIYDGELAGTPYVEDEHMDNPFGNETSALYDKGAWIMHMLRGMMGNDAFFAALRAYGLAHAYGTATTEEFRQALEEHYGAGLDDFFDQWVYTPYRPHYRYDFTSSPAAGGYRLTVTVSQIQEHSITDAEGRTVRDYYRMPMELSVVFADGSRQTFTLLNDCREQQFSLKVDREPVNVQLDADNHLLCIKERAAAPGDNQLPKAMGIALPRTVFAGMPVILLGMARDTDGSIVASRWIVDNRDAVAGPVAIVRFHEPGQHQVMLTAEDDLGGAGSSVPVVLTVL